MLDAGEIGRIAGEAGERIGAAASERDLFDVKARYLGRKGVVSDLLKQLSSVPAEDRKAFGARVNELKDSIEALVAGRLAFLQADEKRRSLEDRSLDITLPGTTTRTGGLHPITLMVNEISGILHGMGFDVVEGPEVESDWYNFEALNFPPEHPARDMQDTFFTECEGLLRTHTSPVQIRVMERRQPPLRVICPGKVYRRDEDITHSPMFHQVEGFMVDRGISFAHLKGVLTEFLHALYGGGKRVRFRPSFFPFTEPSAEVDVECVVCLGKGCRICKQTGWLEVLGCGMIHPNVMKTVGYDTEQVSGFAFGMGVERLAMLKYEIDDIRLLYDGNITFLEQFA